MELEGLKRTVEFINASDIRLNTLITDRHRQIAAYIRTNLPDTVHKYGIWHVAKGWYVVST